jgi:diguanylate cyclase (GGDEF)-like protein
MSGSPSALQRLWPRTPPAVRDAYALAQYEQLVAQAPLLYGALILIVLAATWGASTQAPPAIRYGIPMLVACGFLVRMVVWMRRPARGVPAEVARRRVHNAGRISGSIAAICSVWCVYSWLAAPAATALYFPLFMAMGGLATVFCVSMSRSAAMLNILAGLAPIVLALLLSGDPMAMAAAASIGTTGGFLALLVRQQHEKTIALLVLQARMRELADTDPLTGLINRRALRDRLDAMIDAIVDPVRSEAVRGEAVGGACGPTLMLLDLDGFKPVNDRHGHGAGDEVLREVARRLTRTIAADGTACRMGGDEFAVLIGPLVDRAGGGARTIDAIGTAILAALARPYPVEGQTLQVGASLGTAMWPRDGLTLDQLYRTADRALYLAKSLHSGETTAAARRSSPQTPVQPPVQAVRNA